MDGRHVRLFSKSNSDDISVWIHSEEDPSLLFVVEPFLDASRNCLTMVSWKTSYVDANVSWAQVLIDIANE